MHAHHIPATITLLLLALASTAVSAQERVEWWPAQQYQVRSGMSLDEAVQMVQSRYNARVVKAETVRSGDRRVHQIRLLMQENGATKVWTVRVDAETGQMF
jgi:uncharacterized membrane protein YkoI